MGEISPCRFRVFPFFQRGITRYLAGMKPMLSIYHPFPGVDMIKIYTPVMPDDRTISFLVIINSRYVSFELYENGEWNDLNEYAISETIVDFVRERIELTYLPPEKKNSALPPFPKAFMAIKQYRNPG